jgi:capsular polysaccharide biosynthesis protein/Mrp family chromosome partitioning ATPase
MAAASSRPDSLELGDYLGVLRRRWWIVALLVVIGVGAGAGYVKVAAKTYTGSVLVQVNPLPNSANAVAGRTSGSVNMDNEAQIVQSEQVASVAAKQLHSSLTPLALAKSISVSVPPNTTFLQIKCGASTPSAAAACANAFGKAYLSNRSGTAASGISALLTYKATQITALTAKVSRLKRQLNGIAKTAPAHFRVQLNLNSAQALLAEITAESNKLIPFRDNLLVPGNTVVGAIYTQATPPTAPSNPRALLVLPSGLLGGLLIGLLAAFGIDARDRRIHGVRDVERFLDLPVLVNLASGKSRMQAVLLSPRSRAGQAFTELSQYIAASLGEGSHVVFVAGTSAGSGCSVLAANLAATLARTRSGVVLVCADPRTTVTPALLGVPHERGLAEVLSGAATAADVARTAAEEPRLKVITPGVDVPGALLNLQYETSRKLLSELRKEYGYVIVEVQSVGEDSSAFALAEFADAAIMGVETSLTTRPAAAECLQRLDRLRTSVLGAVVLPAPGSRPPRPLPEVGTAARQAAPVRSRADARPVSPLTSNGHAGQSPGEALGLFPAPAPADKTQEG